MLKLKRMRYRETKLLIHANKGLFCVWLHYYLSKQIELIHNSHVVSPKYALFELVGFSGCLEITQNTPQTALLPPLVILGR